MDKESSDAAQQPDSPGRSAEHSSPNSSSENGTNETFILPEAYVTERYGTPHETSTTDTSAQTEVGATDPTETDSAPDASTPDPSALEASAPNDATDAEHPEPANYTQAPDSSEIPAADQSAPPASTSDNGSETPTPSAPDHAGTSASEAQVTPHAFDVKAPVEAGDSASQADITEALVNGPDRGIVVSHLSRKFGKTEVLRDVTFSALPGKITALVGPNGAGKTTLLLILSSLLKSSSGNVEVCGVDPVAHPQAARALIGWMPDTIGIWPNLSARQSLRAIGAFYGLSRSRAKQRADELLRTVGLFDLSARPTRVLSRGQRQRLSFARALVHDPSVLILDEPMSGLDPEARVEMRTVLRRLADDGKTILLSSHVLAELEEFADDAIYLANGATVTADELAAQSTQRSVWLVETLDQSVAVQRLSELKVPYTIRQDKLLIEVDNPQDAAAVLRRLVAAGVDVIGYRPELGNIEKNVLQLAANGIRTDSTEQEDAS